MSLRRVILLAILAIPTAVYLAPLLETHSEQDECSFSPVGNREYRGLLWRAWPLYIRALVSYSWDDKANERLLSNLFNSLTSDTESIYRRIAGAHALMRSLGAEYRGAPAGTAYGDADPFSRAALGGFVHIQYALDVNRLGLISPYPRNAGITVTLGGPRTNALRNLDTLKQGEIRFSINNPNVVKGPEPIGTWPPKGSCPLIPSADVADQFAIAKE
jgi:hypothetical protein